MTSADLDAAGALTAQARRAFERRDPATALTLLLQAEAIDPSLDVLLDKALALRMLGRVEEALLALDGALALDPRNLLALLSKGALAERLGRGRQSVFYYKAALDVAPAPEALPAGLAEPLAKAKAAVAKSAETLAAYLEAEVAPLRARFTGEGLERFDESLQIYAGRAEAFVQQPLLFHYPRLPPIPFYDRELFPWLATLEAATDTIREEFLALRARSMEGFVPYIAYPPGIPVNQWVDLNHSPRWSTFYLWLNGVRQDEACNLCPRTAAVLASLPMADQAGYAPTAMFSVLDAHTRIPPHTGSTNTRLVVHLPLVLPGPAWFRVAAVTRSWRMGEAWAFDDTIEHEAGNDAGEPRAILIFDVWNPFLTEAERLLVARMMAARKVFEDAP